MTSVKRSKRKQKNCQGCWDLFFTYKNFDYCPDCAVNGNRYLVRSDCSECDGSGVIKFRGQKPRLCKLCYLTKQNMKRKINKLTPEEIQEKNEQQFWKEVEKTSKFQIADLIESILPISAIPSVFDLEKDVDYRVLLRDDLPQYYSDLEDYQEKITNQTWTQEDVDYVAQDLTCAYFDLVARSLAERLKDYPAFENTRYLTQIKNTNF